MIRCRDPDCPGAPKELDGVRKAIRAPVTERGADEKRKEEESRKISLAYRRNTWRAQARWEKERGAGGGNRMALRAAAIGVYG